MSSILDALERASQNRSSTEQELIPKGYEEGPRPRRWLIWIAALVILLICGVLGFLFYKSQSETVTSEPRRSESLPAPESVSQMAAEKATPAVVKPEKPKQPDLESQLLNSGMPSERSLMSEAKLSRPAEPAQRLRHNVTNTTAAEQTPVSRENQMPAPLAKLEPPPALGPQQLKKPPVAAEPVMPQVNPVPQPIESQQTAVVDDAEETVDETIPLVWELPQGLRDELQQLKISIHVYHKQPERRFVLINMRRYGEGDKLRGTDYLLKQIEREGVVVDYGDGLVRLLRERHY
ncbi:MAG: general secretion pathway protein GspB [Candidatus Thiodiazotropha taylori]|nr:general secretion pathway protein GspB [Candidatus Thiodiazotropha taylori]MCG8026790.1 general secretion pathway protein GspB [Candidatus Thiodiazotropha taylori]MCG8105474.1 general secretion pathway protein GspB [Candidatus Thiodiazotropha taylori]MCG8125275.1 general secretion pathway protein GspB [Candidatus Thiodiazotropha taylori]MCW4254022.1 general secretion pathway protein GspB [Candidatus Thiodiazotropha taylori]